MSPELAEPQSQVGVEPRYPTIVRRYLSTVIDFWLCFLLVAVIGLLPIPGERVMTVRMIVLLAYCLLYEPILTSKLATLGQFALSIRVRVDDKPNTRISIGNAYLRYVVKITLGAISFLTLPFTQRQRAIHDFAAKSMMVRV